MWAEGRVYLHARVSRAPVCAEVCVCPHGVRVSTAVAVRPGCALGLNTKDETTRVTSRGRSEGLGCLGFPLGEQSQGGQAWPGRLLAPEQGGHVPGAVPKACRCPASTSPLPARWLTLFSSR